MLTLSKGAAENNPKESQPREGGRLVPELPRSEVETVRVQPKSDQTHKRQERVAHEEEAPGPVPEKGFRADVFAKAAKPRP